MEGVSHIGDELASRHTGRDELTAGVIVVVDPFEWRRPELPLVSSGGKQD